MKQKLAAASSSPGAVMGETAAVTEVQQVWSFEALYRGEYPGLVAVASAMTGDHDGAHDLVQTSQRVRFGVAHRALPCLCNSEKPRPGLSGWS